jgi:hypothetical protein
MMFLIKFHGNYYLYSFELNWMIFGSFAGCSRRHGILSIFTVPGVKSSRLF